MLGWGMRMAIAATLPVIWGIMTNNMAAATWITLTAECICWMELKGSFGQRLRVLAGGIVLSVIFSMLGSITGNNIWLSVVCMLFVGFFSGLFKNLGDRGAGLATCVYVLFIICNAYPVQNAAELEKRTLLVLAGGVWNALVGLAFTVFMPAQQPYRRTVALIWRSIAGLTGTIAKGWDGNGVRSNMRDIYLKEKEVRTAMDASFHLYEAMAHQVNKKDAHEYELAQVRKATSLVAANIIAISEELERLNIKDTDHPLRLKIYAALKALQQTAERMAVYVVTLKPEEELLLSSRISRMYKLMLLLKEYEEDNSNTPGIEHIRRTVQLIERSLRMIESSITGLQSMGDDLPVLQSYSLIKTVFILHPKHWLRNLQLLFNFNTFTTRYALRTAIAAAAALFIDKWFTIDHGYWLPFTVILVLQPYFGATLKKALDRVLGTVAGGIAGGLVLRLDPGLHLNEILLFISFILMVYYLRKQYAVAAFFITFSLVVLFNMETPVHPSLIYTRAFSTVGGAAIAIFAGFALLPTWDKKWLPTYLANAICNNYKYFMHTFFTTPGTVSWTRLKRSAESVNSNAFDSFNRYMQEPGFGKKPYAIYYHLITHNVRITRELNNINLETENKQHTTAGAGKNQQQRINICLYWFKLNMQLAQSIAPNANISLSNGEEIQLTHTLSTHQMLYTDRMIIELKAMHKDLEKLAAEMAKK